MIIETAYDINQMVVIKEIDLVVTVVGIRLEGKNLIYKCEYWVNGEIRVVDQDEWQLENYKAKGQ